MPWKRVDVNEQRVAFVIRAVSGKERMAVLCWLIRRRVAKEVIGSCVVSENSRGHVPLLR